MNDIAVIKAAEMTSKEIAELTGKRHSDVLRDFRSIAKDIEVELNLDYGPAVFEDDAIMRYQSNQGFTVDVCKQTNRVAGYNLDRNMTLLLVSGYSAKLRLKIIERLDHLESQKPSLPDFSDPVAAARAWADEAEQKQIAQQQLAIAAPKAEFYDAVTGSDDCIDMAQVAKVLNIKGLGRNKLFNLLRDKGVLRKNNQPYQKHVDAGHFRLVETSWQTETGDTRINMKTVALQKGLDYIRKLVEKELA